MPVNHVRKSNFHEKDQTMASPESTIRIPKKKLLSPPISSSSTLNHSKSYSGHSNYHSDSRSYSYHGSREQSSSQSRIYPDERGSVKLYKREREHESERKHAKEREYKKPRHSIDGSPKKRASDVSINIEDRKKEKPKKNNELKEKSIKKSKEIKEENPGTLKEKPVDSYFSPTPKQDIKDSKVNRDEKQRPIKKESQKRTEKQSQPRNDKPEKLPKRQNAKKNKSSEGNAPAKRVQATKERKSKKSKAFKETEDKAKAEAEAEAELDVKPILPRLPDPDPESDSTDGEGMHGFGWITEEEDDEESVLDVKPLHIEARNEQEELEILKKDPNLGPVMAFLSQFSESTGINLKPFSFDEFEQELIYSRKSTPYLDHLHVSLLQKIGKPKVGVTTWPRNLRELVVEHKQDFAPIAKIQLKPLLDSDNYHMLSVSAKLELNEPFLKHLHQNYEPSELRCVHAPFGKDGKNNNYWILEDSKFGVRLFREGGVQPRIRPRNRGLCTKWPRRTIWEMVASSVEELRGAIVYMEDSQDLNDKDLFDRLSRLCSTLELKQKESEKSLRRLERLAAQGIGYQGLDWSATFESRTRKCRKDIDYRFDDFDREISNAVGDSRLNRSEEEKIKSDGKGRTRNSKRNKMESFDSIEEVNSLDTKHSDNVENGSEVHFGENNKHPSDSIENLSVQDNVSTNLDRDKQNQENSHNVLQDESISSFIDSNGKSKTEVA